MEHLLLQIFLLWLGICSIYGKSLSKKQFDPNSESENFREQSNLVYPLEAREGNNPETLICIGSPKCPKVDDGYRRKNQNEGLDFEKPRKNNIFNTEPQNTHISIDDHDDINTSYDGTHNSHNIMIDNPDETQNLSDFDVFHLLYIFLRNMHSKEQPSTPGTIFQADTKKPSFYQNLKGLPVGVMKDNIIINNGESNNSPLIINTGSLGPYYISIKLDDLDKTENNNTRISDNTNSMELNNLSTVISEVFHILGEIINQTDNPLSKNKGNIPVELSVKVISRELTENDQVIIESRKTKVSNQYDKVRKEKKPEEQHTIIEKLDFDLMDLMNNETFWNFLSDLAEKYVDSLSSYTSEFIETEIANQITKYLESIINILKDNLLDGETKDDQKYIIETEKSEESHSKHEKESQLSTVTAHDNGEISDITYESYENKHTEADINYNDDSELSVSISKDKDKNNKYKSTNHADSSNKDTKKNPIQLTETMEDNEKDYLINQSEDKYNDQKDSQIDTINTFDTKYSDGKNKPTNLPDSNNDYNSPSKGTEERNENIKIDAKNISEANDDNDKDEPINLSDIHDKNDSHNPSEHTVENMKSHRSYRRL